ILTNADTLLLYGLNDRRAIIDTLHADPLTITLIGILSIGTVATLLLAIVGDLLASWLSARTRLTNFAVLRALGTSPRQVASVLTWEQALVYSVGVLLGIAFGTLLANTVSPILIANNSSLQASVPTHLVIPFSLIVAFCTVIAIFVLALGMMVRVVSRPSMSQTLRLNED
nr:FtsX-like permease family protein [Ktedonobacteraceae bacterium]